ncbi:hypothetical protein CC86DRAFT_383842 [Ophiobolus disseminans]|uniref:Uncharacterized protein n=1 Tax=Ophiobolus disseminans TaxID=1469910 RepID=A0A6A6ZUY7_9PLEO|nr:hypothetical protein CC86DRAFT_383842 [Ophiobolus disseminans]
MLVCKASHCNRPSRSSFPTATEERDSESSPALSNIAFCSNRCASKYPAACAADNCCKLNRYAFRYATPKISAAPSDNLLDYKTYCSEKYSRSHSDARNVRTIVRIDRSVNLAFQALATSTNTTIIDSFLVEGKNLIIHACFSLDNKPFQHNFGSFTLPTKCYHAMLSHNKCVNTVVLFGGMVLSVIKALDIPVKVHEMNGLYLNPTANQYGHLQGYINVSCYSTVPDNNCSDQSCKTGFHYHGQLEGIEETSRPMVKLLTEAKLRTMNNSFSRKLLELGGPAIFCHLDYSSHKAAIRDLISSMMNDILPVHNKMMGMCKRYRNNELKAQLKNVVQECNSPRHSEQSCYQSVQSRLTTG